SESEAVNWSLITECYSKVGDIDNKLPTDALALAYLKLKKSDLGLIFIEKNDSINHYVLKSYMEEAIITEDEALEKVDVTFCHQLTEDPQKIYQVYKKHFKKREPNPTFSSIIQAAFNAKEYEDVISYFNHPDYQNDLSTTYEPA